MNRILLVEDHARMADLIGHALEAAAGISVDLLGGVEVAWSAARQDVALHQLRRTLRAIGSRQRIVNVRTLGYALHEAPLAE